MLPPERRLGRALELIEEHKFFTLHAGRQTGKTTSLMWLQDQLSRTGSWRALWVDIETAREQPDPTIAMSVILENLERAHAHRYPDLDGSAEAARTSSHPQTMVLRYLSRLAALDPRPLVVLFDEADGLVGEAMVAFLTQLRQGYIERSRLAFPASVVLVGQRQVRDYALDLEDRRAASWPGTTSPFNITAEATTLGSFTEAEVAELYDQHTAATGQRFAAQAVALRKGLSWGEKLFVREVEHAGKHVRIVGC